MTSYGNELFGQPKYKTLIAKVLSTFYVGMKMQIKASVEEHCTSFRKAEGHDTDDVECY